MFLFAKMIFLIFCRTITELRVQLMDKSRLPGNRVSEQQSNMVLLWYQSKYSGSVCEIQHHQSQQTSKNVQSGHVSCFQSRARSSQLGTHQRQADIPGESFEQGLIFFVQFFSTQKKANNKMILLFINTCF